ncbi:hypothetical protein NQ176_g668 [Zarea fungicola]|uniref:Uncharacterized protein n=1 Tax=Zarea fungicola TaxID=93591 RepID=A0ACC1NYT2_9HYPO|nr:hypothetical protein NQ176_g668 [Lecanicillium fungicola]
MSTLRDSGIGSVRSMATIHRSRSDSSPESGLSGRNEPGLHHIQRSRYNPSFYETISRILRIREQYKQEGMVFVKAQQMIPILLGLGASHEDVAKLGSVSDDLKSDPTLPFRKTQNSRFCLDFDTSSIRRLERQLFTLYEDEDFKRHDSGKARLFDEVQNNLQLNTAFQALLVFKGMIINGMEIALRRNLNYNLNQWVCTLFNIRTCTTPNLLGEPALEGVHSDGVDHTMTTFLGASNMTGNSGTTYIHSMDEVTGIQLHETSPHKILACARHSELLDTMLIVDHERKHSLSAVYAEDKNLEATRDILVFFTRRPYQDTHPAASMDSLTPHATLPMEVPLIDLGRI